MTPRNKFLVLIVLSTWLEGIAGASFSNVVVQRNGAIPVGYINYDPSSLSFGNPQAGQLTATPLESVLQVPSVSAILSPCVAPCIIPNTVTQALAPIPKTSNARIISYQPADPNVPVIVPSNEVSRGYQYAYAVYDDQTGDKKSQSEQSDGSVVKGQYSFIQPDGFRREVVYTADDLKGFNAVVRNISPEPEQRKEVEVVTARPPVPCPEPQNAQLTQNKEESLKTVISEIEHLEEQPSKSKSEPKSETKSEPKSEPKSKPKSKSKSVETSEESKEEKEVGNPEEEVKKEKPCKEETRQSEESIENSPPLLNNVIPYNDIIKCLQSKLISANSAVSPLTYILIPSLQGPC